MTSVIDVNQAWDIDRAGRFAEAEAAQRGFDERIANGTLVPTGQPGYYRVNQPGNWDNGEVFYMQRPGLIIPMTGLEVMEDGRTALYTANLEPEWHKLGQRIPGGTSDIHEVMELGGMNWLVLQAPAEFTGVFTGFAGPRCKNCGSPLHEVLDGIWQDQDDHADCSVAGGHVPWEFHRIMPEKFVNYRGDNGQGLAVVGKKYTVVQNEEGFDWLLELAGKGEMIWDSAGVIAGGARTFVCVKLPDTLLIDKGGINDEVQQYVAFLNSHDGTMPITAITTPWRIRCGNTNRFALRDATGKWVIRHTRNAMEKIEEARRNLGLSLKYYEAFAEEETQLARTNIELDEFDKLLDTLYPINEAAKNQDLQKKRQAERKDRLFGMFGGYAAELGRTRYAAEQAITDDLDHNSSFRSTGDKMLAARATAIIEGTNDKTKAEAHKLLLRR